MPYFKRIISIYLPAFSLHFLKKLNKNNKTTTTTTATSISNNSNCSQFRNWIISIIITGTVFVYVMTSTKLWEKDVAQIFLSTIIAYVINFADFRFASWMSLARCSVNPKKNMFSKFRKWLQEKSVLLNLFLLINWIRWCVRFHFNQPCPQILKVHRLPLKYSFLFSFEEMAAFYTDIIRQMKKK